MEKINIKPATVDDLPRIWDMWKTIMDQKVYFPHDEAWGRADIEKSWINLSNQCYVAFRNNEIIGGYILKPNQPGYGSHIANASYFVDTDFRGSGIGKKLCAHSINAAKDHGYRGLQFNLVVSTNESAIKIWQEFGFEIIGTIPGGFRHIEKGYVDAYIFFLDLTV